MSFAFSPKTTFANRPTMSKGSDSFSTTNSKAYEYAITNNDSTSEGIVLEEQWQPIIDIINEKKGSLNLDNEVWNPGKMLTLGIFDSEGQQRNYEGKSKQVMELIKNNPDILPELQDVTLENIYENAKQTALNKRKLYNENVQTTPGVSGAISRFLGEAGAAVTDTVNIGSLLIGGAGNKLLGVVLNNALVGAGSEYLIQGKVEDWYGKLGLEYTSDQFFRAVGMGAFIGGSMPVAFRIAGKTVRLTNDQVKKGIDAFKGTKFVDEGEVAAVDSAIARGEDAVNSNPLVDNIEHGQRLSEADRAIENNEYPNMSDIPNSPIVENSIFEAQTSPTIGVRFNPDEIEVDAKTFQFKEEADAFGQTKYFSGTEKWDPVSSGQIVVYEYANGRQFIADGHQRLAFAKRVKAEGQDAVLIGSKYREVDGVTPAMARLAAARKNIGEGSGTAVDAVKIFKEDPKKFKEIIPPRSALAILARRLVNLSDEDFGLVINGVVEGKYAQYVGKLIPNDRGLQNAALRVLTKNPPENEFQAQAIVKQVIEAGYEKQTTGSLFGDEVISESFFTERSKILDQAVKILRQDKNAFESLVRNADRIEGEGNQLIKEANVDRASQDSKAIAMLLTLANRKGNLSDALTEAAKVARESGNFANPSRRFVESVRNAIRDGEFNDIRNDNQRFTFNDSAQGGKVANDPGQQLETFSEPNGNGTKRQADQLEEDFFGEGIDQTPPKTYNENIKSANDGSPIADPDLLREIPIETIEDGSGGFTARTQTLKEMQEEFSQDKRMLDRLEGCVK